jgi:hypothetical protein
MATDEAKIVKNMIIKFNSNLKIGNFYLNCKNRRANLSTNAVKTKYVTEYLAK